MTIGETARLMVSQAGRNLGKLTDKDTSLLGLGQFQGPKDSTRKCFFAAFLSIN